MSFWTRYFSELQIEFLCFYYKKTGAIKYKITFKLKNLVKLSAISLPLYNDIKFELRIIR